MRFKRSVQISILHKYDYNSGGRSIYHAFSTVSILHKYDYNGALACVLQSVPLFQFYISTIITALGFIRGNLPPVFQFYISTIITPEFQQLGPPSSGFQFYISTIITKDNKETRKSKLVSILHKYDYNPSCMVSISAASCFNST